MPKHFVSALFHGITSLYHSSASRISSIPRHFISLRVSSLALHCCSKHILRAAHLGIAAAKHRSFRTALFLSIAVCAVPLLWASLHFLSKSKQLRCRAKQFPCLAFLFLRLAHRNKALPLHHRASPCRRCSEHIVSAALLRFSLLLHCSA